VADDPCRRTYDSKLLSQDAAFRSSSHLNSIPRLQNQKPFSLISKRDFASPSRQGCSLAFKLPRRSLSSPVSFTYAAGANSALEHRDITTSNYNSPLSSTPNLNSPLALRSALSPRPRSSLIYRLQPHTATMQASCQCGAIAFKTPLPKPLAVYICHCDECRRQSSSAFGCSAIFPAFPLPKATRDGLSVYTYVSFFPLHLISLSLFPKSCFTFEILFHLASFLYFYLILFIQTQMVLYRGHMSYTSLSPNTIQPMHHS